MSADRHAPSDSFRVVVINLCKKKALAITAGVNNGSRGPELIFRCPDQWRGGRVFITPRRHDQNFHLVGGC